MGTPKIYIASHNVLGDTAQHSYLFYDPDTDNDNDAATGTGMEILRGDTMLHYKISPNNNVVVEILGDATQSRDWFNVGETTVNLHFNEILTGGAATSKWIEMTNFALTLGVEDPDVGGIYDTGIFYLVPPNSNSVVNSILNAAGINFITNTPLGQAASDYPGHLGILDGSGNNSFTAYSNEGMYIFYDKSGTDTITVQNGARLEIVKDTDVAHAGANEIVLDGATAENISLGVFYSLVSSLPVFTNDLGVNTSGIFSTNTPFQDSAVLKAEGQFTGMRSVDSLVIKNDSDGLLKTIDMSLVQKDDLGFGIKLTQIFTALSTKTDVKGTDGNDLIYGTSSANTLNGGRGSDVIRGGDGLDHYIWNLGDGSDTIYDDWTDSDKLILGPGITKEMIEVSTLGADLILTVNTAVNNVYDGVLTIKNMASAAETFLAAHVDNLMQDANPVTSGPTLWGTDVGGTQTDLDDVVSGYNVINDHLEGRSGDDTLFGLSGDDFLDGGNGNDVLNGGDGNDRLEDNSGSNILNGGDGADTLIATAGILNQNILNGGAGNDLIYAYGGGDHIIDGGAGADVISVYDGTAIVNGGDGNDILYIAPDDVTVMASAGDDVIYRDTGSSDVLTIQFSPLLNVLGISLGQLNGRDALLTYVDGTIVLKDYLLDPTRWKVKFGAGGTAVDLNTVKVAAYTHVGVDSFTFVGGQNLNMGALQTGGAADHISVAHDNATVSTNAGQDIIYVSGSGSTIDAGDGNDYISGGSGNTVSAGNGNDIVDLTSGTLDAGAGDDTVTAGGGALSIDLGDGNDVFTATGANGTVLGGAGNDSFTLGTNTGLSVFGGDGNDVFTLNGVTTAVYGGDGDDVFIGSEGDDTIYGDAGHDTIDGGNGSNLIYGGDGNDVITTTSLFGLDSNIIHAGSGHDIVHSGGGNDTINGNDGDDRLYGEAGNDTIYGGAGNDTIYGGADTDVVHGGDGNDVLYADGGDDTLTGDTLYGDAGNDTLTGSIGHDALYGGDGDDVITSNGDGDALYGGDGDDTLVSMSGYDLVQGGLGADTLIIDEDVGDVTFSRSGDDLIIHAATRDITLYDQYIKTGGVYTNTVESLNGIYDLLAYTANNAPDAKSDDLIFNEDTVKTGNLFADNGYGADGDPDGPGFTVKSYTQPTYGTLVVNSNGDYTYTPTANYNGIDFFSYTIEDSFGLTDTAFGFVTINAINDAPVAKDDVFSGGYNAAITGNVLSNNGNGADTDVEGDSLSVSAGTFSTAHGSITISSNGAFTYTPTSGYSGTDSYIYTVSDGNGGSDTGEIILTIDPATNAVNDSFTINEDALGSIGSVLTNDTSVHGYTLSVSAFTQTSHGVVSVASNGNVSYLPTLNYNGTDSFTYTISDGHGGTDTATVVITINPVNDAPTVKHDSFSGTEDTPITGNVLVDNGNGADSDIDGDTLTVVSAVANPTYGSVVMSSNGNFVFTPTANYNGSANFTYTLSDGRGGTAIGVVSLTIAAVNDAPIARDDKFVVLKNTNLTGNVLSNNHGGGADSDPEGNTLSVTAGTFSTAHGSVTISSNGSFTYMPTTNYTGMDTFTYALSDGNGGTSSGTASVIVATDNMPILINNGLTLNTDINTISVITTAMIDGFDANNTSSQLVFIPVASPSYGVVLYNNAPLASTITVQDIIDGKVAYASSGEYIGPDSVGLILTDGTNYTSTATFNINLTTAKTIIDGTSSGESITGTSADELIRALGGNDTIDTGAGADRVYAGDGNDFVDARYTGNKYVDGGLGNDTIYGGSGNDQLFGNDNNDILKGNDGNDVLMGGNGADTLYGGAGVDSLYGDAGADLFVFEAASAFTGTDVVVGFSTAQGDALDLRDLLTGYDPVQHSINDFVKLTVAGAHTYVGVDRDGTGGAYTAQNVAMLNNITGLNVNTLISNGNLLVD